MSKTNAKSKGNFNRGEKKEFAPSFGLWPTKKGTGYGAMITPSLLDTLAKAQEGGRLFLQEVPEDKREENDKLPFYRITILNPDNNNNARTEDSDAI